MKCKECGKEMKKGELFGDGSEIIFEKSSGLDYLNSGTRSPQPKLSNPVIAWCCENCGKIKLRLEK